MDRITKALLEEFSRDFSINGLPEDERFEHFANTLRMTVLDKNALKAYFKNEKEKSKLAADRKSVV